MCGRILDAFHRQTEIRYFGTQQLGHGFQIEKLYRSNYRSHPIGAGTDPSGIGIKGTVGAGRYGRGTDRDRCSGLIGRAPGSGR